MDTKEAYGVGTKVRVSEHHRIAARRGMVGRIVGRYGGEEYAAIDVLLSDGEYRLFWPCDLETISSPRVFLVGVPGSAGAARGERRRSPLPQVRLPPGRVRP